MTDTPTATAATGTYDLTPSAVTGGSFTAGNYAITYANGTLYVGLASSEGMIAGGLVVAAAQINQQRADQRLAGIDVDRHCEPGRQRQNRAGHIGADDRIARRHEDF